MKDVSLLEPVTEATRLAGTIAMRRFRQSIAVETKGDGSPVTIADRDAEYAVREWIAARFPGDSIVGEEFGIHRGASTSNRTWYIDPIDGTKSFIHGVPLWGSMVGVASGDQILAGCIYCPAVGDLVVAARGEGAHYNGSRCSVSQTSELSRATILTTDARFAEHPSRAMPWEALGNRVFVSRTWGDCYGYLLVATGRAELMVDDRLSPWDAAALIPIITEAGGVYSDWRGSNRVDGGDGFASNAHLAERFRALLGIPETSDS